MMALAMATLCCCPPESWLGTITGAILGAVIMQSLDSGIVLLGISSATRQLVIGGVLIIAVWFDVVYNKNRP